MENGARREIQRRQKSVKSKGARTKEASERAKNKIYAEVLTMTPKYAEYLTTEGHQSHLEVKKSTNWINRKEFSIEKDVLQTGSSK